MDLSTQTMHTGGHREEDFDGFGAISNLDKSFPLLVLVDLGWYIHIIIMDATYNT